MLAGLDLRILDPPALRARVTKQSYWRVLFRSGKVVNEWECDWPLLPRKGRVAIRLYCPNGQVAQLGNTEDATDRLFQFKVARLTAGGGQASGQQTLAHVIGLIIGTDGQCCMMAWDYRIGKLIGPIDDNANFIQWEQIGRLSNDHLGIKAD